MRANSIRRVAGGAAALMLASATLLSMAGAASGAVPEAEATSEAIPGIHSTGFDAGFRGRFHYQDGSTLARLHLEITTTNAESRSFFSVTKNGSSINNDCIGAITVTCSFRTVRLDDVFVVTVAFDPLVATSSVSATFKWSTTGQSDNDGGDTSHGDTWPRVPTAVTSSYSQEPDFGGGFVADTATAVANLQIVSADNRQGTKVVGTPVGIAATVRDGAGGPASCLPPPAAAVDCSTAFGEWSRVTVGDGQNFDAFQIVITYYSGTPRGFVHIYGPTTTAQPFGTLQEFVGPCAKRSPVLPCFTWSAKNNQATITTLHNGSWRGL